MYTDCWLTSLKAVENGAGKVSPPAVEKSSSTPGGKREDVKPAVATVPESEVDAYRSKISEKRRLARERADREAEEERIKEELDR